MTAQNVTYKLSELSEVTMACETIHYFSQISVILLAQILGEREHLSEMCF